jgi:DNA-binding MarR family transcriptional regulator
MALYSMRYDKNVTQTFNLEKLILKGKLILKEKTNRTVMLNLFVPYRMVNLATNISNACSKIYRSEFDISIPEWRILARLAEHERLNAKDIGRVTFMDKSKVSRAVKILEEKQLIHRQKDENDNRAAYLSLSEMGIKIYAKIAPKALDWEEELIGALDVSEYRDLMRIIEKLDQKVLKMEQSNFGLNDNHRAKD